MPIEHPNKVVMSWANLHAAYERIRHWLGTNRSYTSDELADAVDDVAAVVPPGYVIPSGSININQNGSVDVSGKATAIVAVPAPSPVLQSKTVSPSTSQQDVEPDSGYQGLSKVEVEAISPVKTAADLIASGDTVTVPGGWYASQVTKAVQSGTEGTPTATKGAVSNHAIQITPSVQNSEGYIPGGSHSGQPVTVEASELVNGTKLLNSGGTHDVTDYASASVAAGSEGTPTATKGQVSNQSVTVTPAVVNTEGYIPGGTRTGQPVTVTAAELLDTLQDQAGANDMRSGKTAYDGDGNIVHGTLINLHQPSACYWDSQSNNGFAMTAAFRNYVETAIAVDGAATGYLVNTTTAIPIPVIIHPSTTAGKWTLTGGVTTGSNDDKYCTQCRIDPETGAIEAEATYYIRAITALSRNLADWGIQYLSIYVPV